MQEETETTVVDDLPPQDAPVFTPDEPQETAPAAETAPPEVAVDDGSPRDESGRFAKKAAETAEPPVAVAPEPKREPFVVTANKEQVPIEGVEMVRANGQTSLIVPDDKFNRLHQIIGRGIVAEKTQVQTQQQVQALQRWAQELDTKAKAPRPPSDDEIEAKVVLDYIKPKLADLLNEVDLERLVDKVELAKLKQRGEFRETAEKATAEQQDTEQVRSFQTGQLAAWIDELGKSPEYKDLIGDDEKSEIFSLIHDSGADRFFKVVNEKAPIAQRFVFHDDWLRKQFDLVAKRVAKERQANKAAEDARKFNERNKPNGNIPPAPGKKVTPATPNKKNKLDPKNFDKDAFMRGGYDGVFNN